MVVAEKKHKITMDEDVFSVFGRHEDKVFVHQGQRRPLGGEDEIVALKTIFENFNKFQLIGLPAVAEKNIVHLQSLVRTYNYKNILNRAEIKLKIEELRNCFEDEKLGQEEFQLVAEAENANIGILLTFNPTLIDEGKRLRVKDILKVEIMKPSGYVRKYL
ncbi:MAG: hypothetical protein P8X65_06150 [Syntrophobacterales bacterium]|jgi:hypothetical protein